MKIGILNIYSFPHGLAPTNRIIAYTKGMVKQGAECEIISLKPQVRVENGLKKHGDINGAAYHHSLQIPKFKNRILSSLTFRIGNIICFWGALFHIITSKEKFDTVILSFDQPSLIVPAVMLLKMAGIKMVFIGDEYPTPIRRKLKDRIPAWKETVYRKISRHLKGRILMTQQLADFYNKIYPLPTLLLSTITDIDRFNTTNAPSSSTEAPYLCYMGNMELSKDNVDNIIRAYAIIQKRYPELKFHLYGAPSPTDRSKIQKVISDCGLTDHVIFKGLASYEEVPSILSSAKILVTSQPDTKRAAGGFPTKMGEYMMTGVPCILTNVGEIAQYVTHKDTVFMVPPEEPEAYAEMIAYILDNYEEALAVATNARNYIIDNFSCDSAGLIINRFLKENCYN